MIEHDIGDGVVITWDVDGRGILWKHAGCVNGKRMSAWMKLRFVPDPASTGHVLESGDPEHTEALTIQGSLLCPAGCGRHGLVRNGRWTL
jgi:hypothetical protein